jgi:Xaa-Pro aminopeptidase
MNKLETLSSLVLKDVDCFIVSNDINRCYLTGLKSSAGHIIGFKDKTYLLIDFRYFEKAKNTVKNCEVVLLEKFYEQFKNLCIKHNAKTVLLESYYITLFAYEKFQEKTTGLEYLKSDLLSKTISDLRKIKTQSELVYIREAQSIAEKAFTETLNYIKKGLSERKAVRLLENQMYAFGADAISFETIILTGANSSMPHGVPGDTPIDDGFLLFDFGAVHNNYHSDMTRTVSVGRPTEKMKEVYNLVLEAQNKAIKNVRAGMTGKELDNISRGIITRDGYGEYFGHSLGRGVGLEIHEAPNASTLSTDVLEEGNIITIEPGIYLPGEFGVRIEDFVYVTEGGCLNLTTTEKSLKII